MAVLLATFLLAATALLLPMCLQVTTSSASGRNVSLQGLVGLKNQSSSADMRLAPGSKPFSLNDEARHTESRYASHIDSKFRFSKVVFISAGSSTGNDLNHLETHNRTATTEVNNKEPTESEAPPEGRMADLALDKPSDLLAMTSNSGKVSRQAKSPTTTPKEEPLPTNGNSFFYVDLHGSKDLAHTALPIPTIQRSHSPTDSSSSEELILFAGREGSKGNKRGPDISRTSFRSRANPESLSDSVDSASDGNPIAKDGFVCPAKQVPASPKISRAPSSRPIGQSSSSGAKSKSTSAKFSRKARRPYADKKSHNDAILADYIANMDREDMEDVAVEVTLSARQLDNMETSGWEDEPDESDERRRADSVTSFGATWETVDLQDFDDLSTSDEILAVVKQVFSKRERPSGIQYLVVYEGYTIDDARWIHVSSLDSIEARQKIRVFEIEQPEMAQYDTDSVSEESDEEAQIEKDLQNDMDDIFDEQDLLDRNKERMTDEHIARLLSKQEQLGIGSDELLLFDGIHADTSVEWNGLGAKTSIDWNAVSTPSGKRGRMKGKKRSSADFPSASLLADVLDQDPYNGFDVMDMERPSLKKKSKGRRGTIAIEVSDSELEQSLEAAWANDRTKKKKRKQEREELRAQGLLGKKGKVDMKAKYSQGMVMAQVKEEIKGFLASTNES